MTPPAYLNKEDLIDRIDEWLTDSLDAGWTCHTGARAVVEGLIIEGLVLTNPPEMNTSAERVNAELIAMERLMIRWRIAAQRWTPGGSEYMDPAYCEAFIAEQRQDHSKTKVENARLRKALASVQLSGGGSDEPSLRESPAPELRQLQQRIRELEAALHPFAAFAYAMTAYGLLHRGSFPADSESMAYVQTEAGDSGNVTWGDFKLAQRLMPDARYGGESAAMRWARAGNRKDGSSQKDSPSPDIPPAAGAGAAWREKVARIICEHVYTGKNTKVSDLELTCADAILALSTPDKAADAGGERRPIETAPKGGEMIWLLVDYSDGGAPLIDATQAWTIGFNNLGNTGENRWQFAGWDWTHDRLTEGSGTPVAWKPLGFELDGDADALSAAPPPADSGWMLVPREPTKAMIEAAAKHDYDPDLGGNASAVEHYRAMLAAVQEP